ncbi:MAG TPA: hypothetical protein VGM27_05745 [Acidobacteriaceae bacterium]
MSMPLSEGPPRLVMTEQTYAEPHCSRSPAVLCAVAEPTQDRKQLIFTAFDGTGRSRELIRADIDPQSYLDYEWDLSPDGSRIAVLKAPENLIKILSVRGGPAQGIGAKQWRTWRV